MTRIPADMTQQVFDAADKAVEQLIDLGYSEQDALTIVVRTMYAVASDEQENT